MGTILSQPRPPATSSSGLAVEDVVDGSPAEKDALSAELDTLLADSDLFRAGLNTFRTDFEALAHQTSADFRKTLLTAAIYPFKASHSLLQIPDNKSNAVHDAEQALINAMLAKLDRQDERTAVWAVVDGILHESVKAGEHDIVAPTGVEDYVLPVGTWIPEEAERAIEDICKRLEVVWEVRRADVRAVLLSGGLFIHDAVIGYLEESTDTVLAGYLDEAVAAVEAHADSDEVFYVLGTALKRVLAHHLAEDKRMRDEVATVHEEREEAFARSAAHTQNGGLQKVRAEDIHVGPWGKKKIERVLKRIKTANARRVVEGSDDDASSTSSAEGVPVAWRMERRAPGVDA